MSEALNKLREIGAQRIYEDTHIPVNQVQAILYENYEGLTKVQFIGFVSILEREYAVDLQDVKDNASAYFLEKKKSESSDRIFVEPIEKVEKGRWKLIVGSLIVLLLAIALYLNINTKDDLQQDNSLAIVLKKESKQPITKEKEKNFQELDEGNLSIVPTKQQTLQKNNVSIESNLTTHATLDIKKQNQIEDKVVEHSLEIIPLKKVWFGYIDVKTNKRYQKTLKRELKLDAQKEWLFLFGHGYVAISIDGVMHKYKKRNTLRLHYKDGSLKEISKEEFKHLNRGRKW